MSPVTISFSLSKLGVPKPVTASQPFVAFEHESQQEYNTGKRGATYIETWRPTARIVADRDIVEGSREDSSDGVDQGIEESKR